MKISNQGFTLLEVLIMAGVVGLLAMGFSTMMINQAKQQKAIAAKNAFNALVIGAQGAAGSGSAIHDSAYFH
jgi:type II secretory pathway pseudopilin PulG